MTNAIPIRVVVDGSGDTTGLSEFRTNETVGLDHGGTGATNAADARTNLGLAAIAASGSWADLLNKPNTDDIPEGTTNLYFTDERVDDRVAALIVDGVGILKNYDDAGNLLNIEINFSEFDTDDIIEGSVNTFLANRSTSDIPEGTNLYFTDERVDDRVAALIVDGVGIQKNYDDAGNLLNIAIDFSEFDTDDIVEGTVNTFLSNRTTDDINEGTVNLYFTDARADARIALQTGTNLDLSQKTTTELSEGTNLYYTDARADARLATFGAVTQSDIDASIAALIDSSPTTLDTLNELAAALGDDPNFATSIANSIATKLAISDFNTTADNWLGTKSTTDLSEGTNLYFTDERVDDRVAALIQDGVGIVKNYDDAGNLLDIAINFAEFDTDDIVEGSVNTFLASRTTDDISEGTTNLYYTDTRVRNAVSATGSINYDSATGVFSFTQGDSDTINEGSTNLFFTDERVDDRVAALIQDGVGITKNYDDAGNLLDISINFTEFDTDDIIEGTVNTFLANRTTDDITEGSINLYYTDARFDTRLATKSTTDVAEGANLYYTDARVDANIATKSTTDVAEGTNLYYTDARFDTRLTTKSTTDVAEGTNLYYTDARVDANIATKTTTDVAEGINLYYTDARVDTNIATKTTDDINEGTTNLYYTDARFDARLTTKSTTDVAEGTNLYYTDARVDTNFATKTTTDLTEGTNLYYTDVRVATYLTNNGYTTAASVASQIESVSSDLDDEIYDREQADLNLQSQIDNLVLNDLTDVNASSPTSGDALVWNGTSWVPQAPFSQADFDFAFAVKTTTDLTEGTNLYYTDARVRSHVEGQDLDLGSNKILFSNVYSALGDLPNASSYHGMFAHVHGTGKAYYAHAGNWVELANNSELPTSTDDVSEGSTNLYFTEERVDDRVAALIQAGEDISIVYDDVANTLTIALASSVGGLDLSNNSTDDLSEGSTNLYYTNTRVDANFATKTTTDLTEGTNLYYTDARFDARLATKSTTDVAEGTNLYYTDARVDANIATKTTDDINEGTTNLYYTDTRVNTFLGSGNAGNIITTGYIAGPASLTIDPAGVGDNTGTVIIAGNLQVDGTTTTINSTTVEVDDLNIVLGSGSVNAAAANGGGITIDLGSDGSATFTYNSTTDQFVSNKDITANITGQVSDISNHTTTDLVEGINLYYTQVRFDTAFGAKTTTDLTEGTNLYYTDARFDARIATKTTDNLIEGLVNLYYTDARVDANFATKTTTDLTEGTNLYYTQTRFDTAFAAKDTDALTEGSTNLYYTDARVNTWTTANLANVAFSGSYADLSNTPTDLSDFTDTTGLLNVAAITVGDVAPSNPNDGDLWFDSTELKTFIYYNDGTSSQWVESAGDGGASVQSSSTAPSSPSDGDLWFNDNNLKLYIYYNDGSSAQWVEASGGIAQDTDVIPEGNNNLYYTDTRFDTRFATKDTDDLVEGSTNLYYTDAKVDTRFATKDTDDLVEGSTNLYYTDAKVDANIATKTTDDINEGTNLYYTDARFDTRLATKSTTDVAEGTNLYYTDARVDARIATSALGSTDDLPEGSTNLYYTDARVQTKLGDVSGHIIPDTNVTYDLGSNTNRFRDIYLSGSSINLGTLQLSDNNGSLEITASGSTEVFATETYVDTAVANLVDSSPTTLDTLNELAAALGDDPNFSTTITNLIGTKLTTADFNTTADSWLTGKTTTDLTEGTNLYYTDARVDARITLQTGANLSLANKTTDDLAEGSTNLYYTDARVETYLESNATADRIQLRTNNAYFGVGTASGSAGMAIKNNSGQPFFYGQKYLPANNGQTDLELEANTGGKINVNAFRIYNVGTPTDPSDAANKSYVDSAIATKDQLSELSGTTDDITEGSTNLYYTDARFDTRLATKSTTDLTEGTNLYYTDARVDARITSSNPYSSADFDTDFSGKTTTDLTEGTNLYYTDARVRSHVEGQDLDLGTNKVLFSNVYNQLSDLPSASSYHGMFAHVHGTGKAYYAHAGNWIELGNNSDIPTSTDSLAEGSTNLYYTDARVGSYLTTNNYATQTYVDNAILTKDTIAEMGDVDLTTAPTNGQGLVWDNANSKWVAGDSFSQSDFDTAFTAKDTDDLSEGSTNLYYTDARVASYLSGTGYATTSYVTSQIAAVFSDLDDEVYDRERADINLQSQIDSLTTNVGALVLDDLGDVDTTTNAPTNGQTLIYNGTSFVPGTISGYTTADFNTDFATKTTTDLTEGTNLYYTDARADARVAAANIGILNDVNTVGISAGDFLLYDGSEFLPVDFATEVNTYADGRIGVASIQDLSDVDGVDTVASGDILLYDASNNHFGFINFGSEVNSYFDTRFATKSTTDLAEGTNLYYTDSRFDTRFTTKTADNLTEGSTNLYYTDARVQSYLTAQGIAAETLTSLAIAGNVLTYTDEDGNTTNIDLSLYLDDTNLARLVSGSLNGTTGIATFTRDDATTFTIDFSPLFDDTNLSRINSATFANGTLTLTRDDASTAATVSLDGRYLQDLSGLTTDNLTEGSTNLYYTQARFDSAFTAKSTTDLAEGTNLYYTDARVDARIATSNIVSSSSIDDLSDVDTTTTAPTDGQSLVWDNTNSKWVPGASAGSSIDVSDIAPSSPNDGDLWFDTDELKTYVYYNDGTSSQWVEAAGNVASNVHLSDAAPSTQSEGDLWFNSSNLRLYVYYNDGTSSQWIEASGSVNSSTVASLDDLTDVDLTTTSPTDGQALIWDSVNSAWKPGDVASGGGGGASVSVSDTAPSSPSVGDLWFNSANTKMYVYFNDGTSSQWIQSNPSGASSPIISSDTAPTNPVVNSFWFDSSDGSLYFRYDDGSSEQWVNLIGASLQWQEQSADYTASAGDKLFVDCSSSAVTVTLPSSPTQGDEIRIIDATGNASINNITINRNGSNIQGAADNLIINTDRAAFGLVYYNATQGWLLMER